MDSGEIWRDCNAAERDVLFALRQDDLLTGTEISDHTDRSPATVSRALRSLADRNLVERETPAEFPAPQIENSLSAKGRAVTTAAFDAYHEAL